MTTPCQEACTPWATEADICSPCDDYSFSPGLLDDALAAASDILFMRSGRQFPGSCQDTIAPLWPTSECKWGRSAKVITLPGVVTSVTEVTIDGVALDSSAYTLDDWRDLRRTDGDVWPRSEEFFVTFTYGTLPPAAGVIAAASLACELALACTPETRDRCRLPRRVTQISRQGITAVVRDLSDVFEKGRTGLPEVDLFLSTYNPNRLQRPAAIFNPDDFRSQRRVGT